MKNNRFTSIVSSAILMSAIALGMFACAVSTQAQTHARLKADIPFAFQAGRVHMPAGVYNISLMDDNHLVLFEKQGGGKPAGGYLIATPSASRRPQTSGRLVFDHYGDRYFLRQVWQEGSDRGVACILGKEEKAVIRSQSQQSGTQTQVAVNAEPKR